MIEFIAPQSPQGASAVQKIGGYTGNEGSGNDSSSLFGSIIAQLLTDGKPGEQSGSSTSTRATKAQEDTDQQSAVLLAAAQNGLVQLLVPFNLQNVAVPVSGQTVAANVIGGNAAVSVEGNLSSILGDVVGKNTATAQVAAQIPIAASPEDAVLSATGAEQSQPNVTPSSPTANIASAQKLAADVLAGAGDGATAVQAEATKNMDASLVPTPAVQTRTVEPNPVIVPPSFSVATEVAGESKAVASAKSVVDNPPATVSVATPQTSSVQKEGKTVERVVDIAQIQKNEEKPIIPFRLAPRIENRPVIDQAVQASTLKVQNEQSTKESDRPPPTATMNAAESLKQTAATPETSVMEQKSRRDLESPTGRIVRAGDMAMRQPVFSNVGRSEGTQIDKRELNTVPAQNVEINKRPAEDVQADQQTISAEKAKQSATQTDGGKTAQLQTKSNERPTVTTEVSTTATNSLVHGQFKTELPNTFQTQMAKNPLPLMTPLFAQHVIREMVKDFRLQMNENLSEIRVQLKPESLGEVTFNVRMEDGKMTAHIDVSQSAVRAAMENQLSYLKEALVSKGIDVQHIEISNPQVSADADGKTSHQDQHGRNGVKQQGNAEQFERFTEIRTMGYNTIELIM
jgi:hypothetical protein